MAYKMLFCPDKRGFGSLILYDGTHIVINVKVRSGSVDKRGKLNNCIPAGVYYMMSAPEAPVKEEEDKMYLSGAAGIPWKWRIKNHYLFHPDGGLPGTLGCVGFQGSNCMELYFFAMWYFSQKQPPQIPFEVKY